MEAPRVSRGQLVTREIGGVLGGALVIRDVGYRAVRATAGVFVIVGGGGALGPLGIALIALP